MLLYALNLRGENNRLPIPMNATKLSIVIPTYNEQSTLPVIIERVMGVPLSLEKEIIVVDDGSTDGTAEVLAKIKNIKVLRNEKNQGKGAALRKGLAQVTGDIVVIQDADLEYDPGDYQRLLMPILEGRAEVVFGSRFRGETQRVLYFWHYVGNSLITIISNIFTNLNLSDVYTCYKVFSKEVVHRITPHLKSDRFNIEAELTARIAREGWRVYEVPINYFGRTYKEGKKIYWWDGIRAIYAILWFNLIDR